MSSKIKQLTPEQIYLIPEHIQKWENIAISTKKLDRNRAEHAVNSIYEMLGYKLPNILFFDSPYSACKFVIGQTDKQLKNLFGQCLKIDFALKKWHKKFVEKIYSQIDIASIYSQVQQLGFEQEFNSLRRGIEKWEGIDYQIGNHIWEQFERKTQEQIQKYFGQRLYRFVRPGIIIANSVCQLDYLISTFDLIFDEKSWKTYKLLLKLSNYIYLHENVAIICDRPVKMSFDAKGFLYSEGEPAIQFSDEYRIYSYHMITLPEKYGKIHSKQWQSKWLLTENNCEVREALVKAIGYTKINSELSTEEIDCWYNFILFIINISHNYRIKYLLEINVDTAKIERVKEVPRDVQSVLEAASFVDNYDDWNIASAESKGLEIPF